jgi:hypothetical protein
MSFCALIVMLAALATALAQEDIATQETPVTAPLSSTPASAATAPAPTDIKVLTDETKAIKGSVDAIKFYLQDRQAFVEGKTPKRWVLPPIEEYEKMCMPGSMIPEQPLELPEPKPAPAPPAAPAAPLPAAPATPEPELSASIPEQEQK